MTYICIGYLFLSSITQNRILRETVVSPFLRGDIGWARDKGSKQGLENFSSIGGGLKSNFLDFYAEITIAKLVRKPSEFKKDGWVILFELGQKLL